MIILKVAKKTGLHTLSTRYSFGKTTGEGRGQIDPIKD